MNSINNLKNLKVLMLDFGKNPLGYEFGSAFSSNLLLPSLEELSLYAR
jgi:hypothetical protein